MDGVVAGPAAAEHDDVKSSSDKTPSEDDDWDEDGIVIVASESPHSETPERSSNGRKQKRSSSRSSKRTYDDEEEDEEEEEAKGILGRAPEEDLPPSWWLGRGVCSRADVRRRGKVVGFNRGWLHVLFLDTAAEKAGVRRQSLHVCELRPEEEALLAKVPEPSEIKPRKRAKDDTPPRTGRPLGYVSDTQWQLELSRGVGLPAKRPRGVTYDSSLARWKVNLHSGRFKYMRSVEDLRLHLQTPNFRHDERSVLSFAGEQTSHDERTSAGEPTSAGERAPTAGEQSPPLSVLPRVVVDEGPPGDDDDEDLIEESVHPHSSSSSVVGDEAT